MRGSNEASADDSLLLIKGNQHSGPKGLSLLLPSNPVNMSEPIIREAASPKPRMNFADVCRDVFDLHEPFSSQALDWSTLGDLVQTQLVNQTESLATQTPQQQQPASVFESTEPLADLSASAIEDQHIAFARKHGRIGNREVKLLESSAQGNILVRNGVEAEGHVMFSSIRANVCVFKGKWMYEAVVMTPGIQQIGWCTLQCVFTNEEGVGDGPDSYAFDGKRVKKWSGACSAYGQPWVAGDVIGCCIDLDKGEISFARNGHLMGTAFNRVKTGDSWAYFPGASISYAEKTVFNFGSAPFQYPIEGYQPLQSPPDALLTAKTEYLVNCFRRLLAKAVDPTTRLDPDTKVLFAYHIFDRLIEAGAFSNQFLLESIYLPFLLELDRDRNVERMSQTVHLMHCCMPDEVLQSLLSSLFATIAFRSATSTFAEAGLDGGPYRYLSLALALLRYKPLLESWVQTEHFSRDLDLLFFMKRPSPHDLQELVPSVWWQGTTEPNCDQSLYSAAVDHLAVAVSKVDSVMLAIAEVFLNDSLPFSAQVRPHRSLTAPHPAGVVATSPYHVFMLFLQYILTRNKGAVRNIVPPNLSDRSTLTNVFFCLINCLGSELNKISPDLFPVQLWQSRQHDQHDFPRLGGTLSHLEKHNPPEKLDLLRGSPGPEYKLLDSLVLIFYLGVGVEFKQAAMHLQSQMQAIAQYEDLNRRVRSGSTSVDQAKLAKQVFKEDVIENIRSCAWHRASLFPRWKQEALSQFCQSLVEILVHFATVPNVFAYVPEFYVETVLDSFHALRRADPSILQPSSPLARLVITFLVSHFNEDTIINPDVRDMLLQSISLMLQYKEYVAEFEANEIAVSRLVPGLLETFDKRFWVPVTNVLLRFWKGMGFDQSVPRPQDCCHSVVFQQRFREVCQTNRPLCNSFLNTLFNNLNWTVTEFNVTLKDLQQVPTRRRASPEVVQLQRKCTVMFELSAHLLRLLEFVALELPSVFLGREEINTSRLIEMLLLILSRSIAGPTAALLDSLSSGDGQHLEKISRAAILGPVAGILVNLFKPSSSAPQDRSLVDLTAEAQGLNMDLFMQLQAVDWRKDGPDAANLDRLPVLKEFVTELKETVRRRVEVESNSSASAQAEGVPEEELCSICYSMPHDTSFIPCGHRSCNLCVRRHLLNSTRCFFCNAEIETTKQDPK
eukprot:GILK01003470.1.p1 GENE.GILK01003470.1~~GILK01003470.1.p1  ORF type:complete len:1178 (+),score=186.27 GILK01003470.1:64-3597(+)